MVFVMESLLYYVIASPPKFISFLSWQTCSEIFYFEMQKQTFPSRKRILNSQFCNLKISSSHSVWPDLTKVCQWGKLSRTLPNIWRFIYCLTKFWTYFGKIIIHFGQIWSIERSQIMKSKLIIWSHCCHCTYLQGLIWYQRTKRIHKNWTKFWKQNWVSSRS